MTCSIFPFHLECSFRYSPSISDEKQQLKITIQLNINDHLDEWEKSDNKNEFQWIIVILFLSQHQNEKEKEILVSITYMNRSCQIFHWPEKENYPMKSHQWTQEFKFNDQIWQIPVDKLKSLKLHFHQRKNIYRKCVSSCCK